MDFEKASTTDMLAVNGPPDSNGWLLGHVSLTTLRSKASRRAARAHLKLEQWPWERMISWESGPGSTGLRNGALEGKRMFKSAAQAAKQGLKQPGIPQTK